MANKNNVISMALSKVKKHTPNITEDNMRKCMDALLEAMQDCWQSHEDVQLKGFGTFKSVKVPASKRHIAMINKTVETPAHYTVKFKLSSAVKDSLK